MNSKLSVEHISKKYGLKQAVKDLSFSVSSGEIVGLLGPNGAGKTTAFYIIAGLIKSDSGIISLNSKDITNLPVHTRASLGLGYLPQEASIFRKLSVSDNILSILETRTELLKEDRFKILNELLEEFKIGHVKDNIGISLSGGERRRVEIARSLAINPKFILLDEPFAGVDPISVIDIQKIIKQLTDKKIGVLITDHNVRETLGICNHAYIINQGTLMASGKSAEILSNQKVRDVYLGDSFSL
tara:strand:- start:11256 stop:11984 length:729 start_codon:yes stop_codon:yes gene_type:complete